MSRTVLLPLVSLSLLLCQSAFAQEEPVVSDEGARCDRNVGCSSHPQMFDGLDEAAEQAHVERSDLLGALNKIQSDTGVVLGPFEYLYGIGELKRPIAPSPPPVTPKPAAPARGRTTYVRVTHYFLCCLTANGGRTTKGTTACSTNFAFGTTFTFRNGSRFVCNDRGKLFYNSSTEDGWLDLWGVVGLDGHATVTVN